MSRSIGASALIVLAITIAAGTATATELTMLSNPDPCDCEGSPFPWDYNDVWGFTRAGTDYAVLGSWTGVYIYDLTDPSNPVEASFVAGPNSNWRDMKTIGNYLYATNETGGGLQIIDITDPYNAFDVLQTESFFVSAHNLYIDEASSRAYIFGADGTQSNPILDLTIPTAPTQLGNWDVHYLHDGYARGNVMYGSKVFSDGGVDPGLFLVDVTDPTNMSTISNFTWPNSVCHNVWLTDDGNYAATTDETTGGHLRMWDLTDPQSPSQVSEYMADPESIIHNVLIRGDRAYISYYNEGVRVVDVSNPNAIFETGFYDTTPGGSPDGFGGVWGIYAFESGIILGSDVETGLYVLEEAGTTGIALDLDASPANVTAMSRIFPNPFNPQLEVELAVGATDAGAVRVRVFDAAGRFVQSLHDGPMATGTRTLRWDGRDVSGRSMASGTYYVRLETPSRTETQSAVMLK